MIPENLCATSHRKEIDMKNIGIMIQTTASGILAYISAKLGILFPVLLFLGL